MTKKKAPTYDTKPIGPVHPSLSSSGKPKDAHSLVSNNTLSGNSVNDLIQQLRNSQGVSPSLQGSQIGRPSSQILIPGTGPSLPPSLRRILQLPDGPSPRPRPSLRVTGRTRGLAGPAPPASWTQIVEREPRNVPKPQRGISAKTEQLPGSFLTSHGSLVHTALKALAVNWEWHVQYDQYYLATIPIRYKEALLSYVARYSDSGISKGGLEVLFLDEPELEDATGVEGLSHLDLSTSIGHPLQLKQLKDILAAKKTTPTGEEPSSVVPDSWDTPDLLASPSGLPKFYSLTHLSLSHPNNAATWKALLELAPYLTTITHLSLAYWPRPTMSPNSTTAYRLTPQGTVSVGASSFYSVFDNDWTEAASILRRLGKSTYCLKWLDLTGCFPWVQALKYDQIDWHGAWGALETVKIGQGYIPECFHDDAAETAWRDVYGNRVAPLNYETSIMIDNHKKRQLIEWVEVEGATMGVVEVVNTKIGESIRKASYTGVHELAGMSLEGQGFDGWARTSVAAVSARSRSQRITFDRGWDSWWIRDAIHQIREMEARGQRRT